MAASDSSLTQQRLTELFEYDPHAGQFIRKTSSGTRWRAGQIAGTFDKNKYRQIKIDGKVYKEHRLVWLYVYGVWPDGEIDHIDRNPNNNKLSNLRTVSRKENAENIAVHKDNVSKFKGVTFDKRKSVWFARIMHNKVAYHLGTYKSPEEASLAYIKAAKRFHRYNAACTKQGLL